MLRPSTIKAVGEKHYEAALSEPFGYHMKVSEELARDEGSVTDFHPKR
jgi:hypothetical protein